MSEPVRPVLLTSKERTKLYSILRYRTKAWCWPETVMRKCQIAFALGLASIFVGYSTGFVVGAIGALLVIWSVFQLRQDCLSSPLRVADLKTIRATLSAETLDRLTAVMAERPERIFRLGDLETLLEQDCDQLAALDNAALRKRQASVTGI